MFLKDTDERKISVAFREIEAVAHHKVIVDFESDVIRFDVLDAPGALIEEHADFQAARLERPKGGADALDRSAGVENIIDEQHVASSNIETKLLCVNEVTGPRLLAVTGNPDEIEPERQREVADQVRKEKDRSVQKGNDDQVAAPIVTTDLARESADAFLNLVRSDEDAIHFTFPDSRDENFACAS